MALIKNYDQFVIDISRKGFDPYIKRFQELAGIRGSGSDRKSTYIIEISFDFGNILIEHKNIKNFKKTNNRYYYHPEQTHPPVKAHYHVIPSKGNREIYAVNVDGTAHHRVNQGYQIPQKEAEELRRLGVSIKSDNIIEHLEVLIGSEKLLLNESLDRDSFSLFVEIEE